MSASRNCRLCRPTLMMKPAILTLTLFVFAVTAQTITSPSPLYEAAMLLEKRYHKVVTYEEPLSVWRGELIVKGRDPDGPFGLWLRDRRFVIPDAVNSQRTPELDLAVLSGITVAYNFQNADGTLFRATASRLGLHILPLKMRDAKGNLVRAASLLDAYISVPSALRMPSEHVQTLCDAVAASTGVSLKFNYQWLDMVFAAKGLRPPKAAAQLLSPKEKEKFSIVWGAEDVTAREALLSLTDLSAAKLTWYLLCQPSAKPENRFCVFNMDAKVVGKDGR